MGNASGTPFTPVTANAVGIRPPSTVIGADAATVKKKMCPTPSRRRASPSWPEPTICDPNSSRHTGEPDRTDTNEAPPEGGAPHPGAPISSSSDTHGGGHHVL